MNKTYKDRAEREAEARAQGKKSPAFECAFLVLVPVGGGEPIFQLSGIDIVQGLKRKAKKEDVYFASQYLADLYRASLAAKEFQSMEQELNREAGELLSKTFEDNPLLVPIHRGGTARPERKGSGNE